MGFIPEHAINSSLRHPAVPYFSRVFIPRRYSVDTGRRFMPKQLIVIWQEACVPPRTRLYVQASQKFTGLYTCENERDQLNSPDRFAHSVAQRRSLIAPSNISYDFRRTKQKVLPSTITEDTLSK